MNARRFVSFLVLLAAAYMIMLDFDGLPYRLTAAQGIPPPEDTLRSLSNEFIRQFNLPVSEVTIALHAEVAAENAAALATELAQATRVMFVVRSPLDTNSPSLFATLSVPENVNWLAMEPTIPALEQQLRDDVLLPGRKVYRLRWESAVSTDDGQPLPPELSPLAASFESLAVFDASKGVVYDSTMALPVLDLTSFRTSPFYLYLPLIIKQAQSIPAKDMTASEKPRSSGPAGPAWASDSTHRLMGRQAAILAGIDPPYAEIGDSTIIDQIAGGDVAEDERLRSNVQHEWISLPGIPIPILVEVGDSRFFHHFYNPDNPETMQGLEWHDWYRGLVLLTITDVPSGKLVRLVQRPAGDRFSSALEWARNQHADGLDWEHAIEMYDYHPSSKQLAYRWVGHVVHLLQDMAMPDHALLQPHPGSGFGLNIAEDLGNLVGFERLWDILAGQWPTSAWPGCPGPGDEEKLDDFFDTMARRSIAQSKWWETERKVPAGIELALGLTYLGEEYNVNIPFWEPEITIDLEYMIPLVPTIPVTAPGNFRTMGETLTSEAVACSAALLRFYYDIVNHPPYVVEVIVKQPNRGLTDDIVYRARWEDGWESRNVNDLSSGQPVTVKKLKERQLVRSIDHSLADDMPATIELRFGPFASDHGGASKMMDEDSIQVFIGDVEATKEAFGQQEDDGPVFWRGAFTPKVSTGEVLPITIAGIDSHNHFVHRDYDGSMLDADPQTAAKALWLGPSADSSGPGYEWVGYEPGEDRNHRVLGPADRISAGLGHSCAVIGAAVFCWGTNVNMALGTPTTETCWGGTPCSTVPIQVIGGSSQVASVSAGFDQSCAVTADGDAYCWGLNLLGSGGVLDGRTGTLADRVVPSPTPVFGDIKFKAISTGGGSGSGGTIGGHTCGLDLNGKAYCWGKNYSGQLGTSTGFCWERASGNGLIEIPCSTKPVEVQGNITFKSISTGVSHTCGVSSSNQAYCWGANDVGQLGVIVTGTCGDPNNLYPCSDSPVFVGNYKRISAAGSHTCAIDENDVAFCWGSNWDGQLGRGTVDAGGYQQLSVLGDLRFKGITAGSGDYYSLTCGITTNGQSYCWGRAVYGRLGNGIDDIDAIFSWPSPDTLVSTTKEYSKISIGGPHSCAVAANGSIDCWGENHLGQLGVSTAETCREDDLIACSTTPVQVIP